MSTRSAVEFVEFLLEKGSWYISAIELDFDVDGEELEQEVERIIESERQKT